MRIYVLVFLLQWFFLSPVCDTLCLSAETTQLFGFQNVIAKARALSKKAYNAKAGSVPEFLLKISYDDWRDIRFDPKQALWLQDKLFFTAQFFHPGLFYDRIVTIHVVDTAGVHDVPFSPELFDYGRNSFKNEVPPKLGFSGFRLHYPVKTPDYYDEVVVFLGASYLRAVAQKQNYGISARGLAVDTALAKGEEFPYFKEYWLLRPARADKYITVFALLDSPSVTGAYRYTICPGKETVIKVKSTLFLRNKVEKLGIAPLTSMFFYGENTNERPVDDFRPEVHDSDGLMVATGSGEWIWRPLANPRSLMVTSFQTKSPKGFGLIQRDLVFDHYQDLEAHYETRPSVWITPKGNWAAGRVELIQIPSLENEINDNIVAFWAPSQLPQPNQPLSFSYEMNWHFPNRGRPPGGWVIATRTAKGNKEGVKKFIIDFVGERLESLSADTPLTGVITVDSKAKLIEQQLYKNRETKGWRLVFQIDMEKLGPIDQMLPQEKRPPIELRAFLKLHESVLTETWSYAYRP
jgi:glucans biosynthesis protein